MKDDSHLEEVMVRSERVFEGVFLHVNRDMVRLPDGNETAREYLLHPGAVMIVALLDDGTVVMERQWRYPLSRAFIEFPAGKIDTGEAPLATCIRELREETGYTAMAFTFITTIHNAISYSNEHIDLYLAEGLTPGERKLDDGEFLDVFTVAPAQILDWVRDGTITDVKTIIGAFWLEKILARQWPASRIA
ncbi:MAG: NUDIX hydrolase [Burkholderiaceae bacterium]